MMRLWMTTRHITDYHSGHYQLPRRDAGTPNLQMSAFEELRKKTAKIPMQLYYVLQKMIQKQHHFAAPLTSLGHRHTYIFAIINVLPDVVSRGPERKGLRIYCGTDQDVSTV